MEIRHIPNKINLVDTITKQMKSDHQVYFGEVKQLCSELMDTVGVRVEASDAEVQRKLDQLYNSDETRNKRSQASKQVFRMDENAINVVLVVTESNTHIDS